MNDFQYFISLFSLVLLQALVLNNILFMGFASPMLYLVFFMLYPNDKEQILQLCLAFFSGLFLDIFANTGGVYAASTLCVVFLRPIFLQFFFGKKDKEQRANFQQVSFLVVMLYVLVFVLIHHSIFYLLEVFNLYHLQHLLKKILVSTALTSVVCMLVAYIKIEQHSGR